MGPDSLIGFHSPYYYQGSRIVCDRGNEELKEFVFEMLGPDHGKFFYDRLSSYCGSSESWTLNRGAAEFFNLLTSPGSLH